MEKKGYAERVPLWEELNMARLAYMDATAEGRVNSRVGS